MQAKNLCRTGFTYVEMAIVLLVMGIFTAIAAPSYLTTLAQYHADMAARKIEADLQFSRSEAVRSSRPRTVSFETGLDRYVLVDVSDLEDSNEGYRVYLNNDPFSVDLISATFPDNATFEKVMFDRFGRPDSAGTVVVRSGSSVLRTVKLYADGSVERIVP